MILDLVPSEITIKILSYLHVVDYVKCALLNKVFFSFVRRGEYKLYCNVDNLVTFHNRYPEIKLVYIPSYRNTLSHELCNVKKMASVDTLYSVYFNGGAVGCTRLNDFKDSSVQSLKLSETSISDKDCENLAVLHNLRELAITSVETSVTDRGLKHLAGLVGLEKLSISDHPDFSSGISNISLRKFSGLVNLTSLYMKGTNVDTNGLKYLSEMTKLRSLDISSTLVDSNGCRVLGGIPSLVSLHIVNTKVEDYGLGYLTNLESLYCDLITLEGIPNLIKLKKLKKLNLFCYNDEFEDEDLNYIANKFSDERPDMTFKMAY